MPRSIPCPTCGGLYFSSSLPIHQRTCVDKASRTKHECPFCKGFIPIFELQFHVQRCAARPLRDDTRVLIPLPPLRGHVRPLGASAAAGGGSGALSPSAYGAARSPCSLCGRVFALERLLVHENACKLINKPRPTFSSKAQRAATCNMDAGGFFGGAGPGDGTFGAPPPIPRRAPRPSSRPATSHPPAPTAAEGARPPPPPAFSSSSSSSGISATTTTTTTAPRPSRSASSPPSLDRARSNSSSWRDQHEGFHKMLAQARMRRGDGGGGGGGGHPPQQAPASPRQHQRQQQHPQQQQQQQLPQQYPQQEQQQQQLHHQRQQQYQQYHQQVHQQPQLQQQPKPLSSSSFTSQLLAIMETQDRLQQQLESISRPPTCSPRASQGLASSRTASSGGSARFPSPLNIPQPIFTGRLGSGAYVLPKTRF